MKLPCATPCPTVPSWQHSVVILLEKVENMDWHLACRATSLCQDKCCDLAVTINRIWTKTTWEGNTALFSVSCMGRQRVWQVPFSEGGALQQQGFYEKLWLDVLTWNPKCSSQVFAHQSYSEGQDCPAEFVFKFDHIKLIYSMFLIFLYTETHKSLSLQPS